MLRDLMNGKGGQAVFIAATLAIAIIAEEKHEAGRKPIPSPEEIRKLPADGGKEYNRLIFETSPYLLQHASNPVNWYPWGKEAFSKAKKENKPVFLSVGYSACHWCHVMEHQSFENVGVAEILNKNYVCIKVDREERPDVDEIYMNATQLLTGRGGWPNSVFLRPDGRPFWAGTYFPRLTFMKILKDLNDIWMTQREKVDQASEGLTKALKNIGAIQGAGGKIEKSIIENAAASLRNSFDSSYGGFGRAPKFPPSKSLSLLLRQHRRTGDKQLLHMVELTLEKMAFGGMYDQVGGGFHRYSTDARWLVPHFEKMLYDNALLTSVYLDAYQATQKPLYRRITEETFEWVLREMTSSGGGFYSSLDADSEGEEGKFYVWSPSEVTKILGDKDGQFFCDYYDITAEGNFEGHSIANLPKQIKDVAPEHGLGIEEGEAKLNGMKAKLLAVRVERVWPGLDDKILTSWNALMIESMARGYQVLGNKRYLDAAERATSFILKHSLKGSRLLATHRAGKSKLNAYLDDYAYMTSALLTLYESTFKMEYLDSAMRFNEVLLEHFWDDIEGGFFFISDDHETLLVRSKKPYDSAIPSGNSVAVQNLLRLAKLTDNRDYRKRAVRTMEAFRSMAVRSPRGFGNMFCAIDFYLDAPKEIALAGRLEANDTQALIRTVHSIYLPNKVIALIDPKSKGAIELEKRLPLLAQKSLVNGMATAYVCENYACKMPVNEPEKLAEQLGIVLK